jgi:hypothetical protein
MKKIELDLEYNYDLQNESLKELYKELKYTYVLLINLNIKILIFILPFL